MCIRDSYWTDCVPGEGELSLTLDQIVEDLILPAGKPTLAGVPCGHSLPTMSLPLGATAILDAGAGTLEVEP